MKRLGNHLKKGIKAELDSFVPFRVLTFGDYFTEVKGEKYYVFVVVSNEVGHKFRLDYGIPIKDDHIENNRKLYIVGDNREEELYVTLTGVTNGLFDNNAKKLGKALCLFIEQAWDIGISLRYDYLKNMLKDVVEKDRDSDMLFAKGSYGVTTDLTNDFFREVDYD